MPDALTQDHEPHEGPSGSMRENKLEVHYFDTDEDRTEYIKSNAGLALPQVASGSASFFRDFGQWFGTYQEPELAPKTFYVLPEPELNIAFPFPCEEIGAAIALSAGSYPQRAEIIAKLTAFGLEAEHANRPVVALSGGERLLLSFAKASCLAAILDHLVLCSPTHWLNRSAYRYLSSLITEFVEGDKRVTALLLRGETLPSLDSETPPGITPRLLSCTAESKGGSPKSIRAARGGSWRLDFSQLVIEFPESSFPLYSPAKRIVYRNMVNGSELQSPTALLGPNGVGKSVFAKSLGRLVTHQGRIKVSFEGFGGIPRIVFQDCLEQLFGRPTESYLSSVMRFDERSREAAEELYREMEEVVQAEAVASGLTSEFMGDRTNPDSVLQARIALIAERLVSRAPMIILDEPGWRLSQPLARGLLKAVCAIAHRRKMGVLVITHLAEWWDGILRSQLSFERVGSEIQVTAG